MMVKASWNIIGEKVGGESEEKSEEGELKGWKKGIV